ncbi:MAG: F0F1 ATP synthase subunit gamma [Candidatus Nomurabacteria bacterium GW2011_GWF2_43_8]|uniref:ATP synthase gamma chain n=3 Tax=Candidatus Nomuraibacteriota TaxID=1752729 RepID=A0A0G1IPR6_9BACT|nr:MAG: F0F1 ATP synthase subunit gamma [Candidatus Nomurabacteria bacterium GW2011_GWA2_43_15]KKT19161.1 MAG: F0F1 ATP synthase subunit gamma [Candidatus Nomurabacteria bacterium GW2011_GWB1_43_7]KKT25174.1 MAG: F0F1 ATP synthase subunit gamma [Candidatus Nomurabacteria bacterium GW2011_GWF2_43_8]
MAGTKEIKRRIKSVKNTKKITKAMELVAASKMKHAISSTLASRPYARYSWEVLEALTQYIAESTHPLFVVREPQKLLIILLTSNRGLCGGYNSQVIKSALSTLKENKDKKIDFISVGKKGEAMLRRLGQNIIASFNQLSEKPRLAEILPVINMATESYKKGEYDRVLVASTSFVSAIFQKAGMEQLFPVEKKKILETLEEIKKQAPRNGTEYIFEPNYGELMNIIVEKIVRTKFYQLILESNASEQSSRMVAMKNASEASGEMIDDLTLMFNKARQANITREISEISAGMASVN